MDHHNLAAVVVGGSNGIGLAISNQLMKKGYYTYVLDICPPREEEMPDRQMYEYHFCDVTAPDEELLRSLSGNSGISFLMITAGIGRIADFEDLHPVEIRKVMKINTAAISIIRAFYDRIKAREPFFCGVMGSIAGLISSPMFSVYAASKAAICRFIESVNIELELGGTSNRILNVSPGSIKGTRFNGGGNDLNLTAELAEEIIEHTLRSECLFIPEYEEVFKGVIGRYQSDPHAFGLSSYQYKLDSGRVSTKSRVKIGYLSGTFDLFHVGHLRLLERAKKQCDYLIVGVHPDASHKGKETFIPFDERKEIVAACKYVDKVIQSMPEDSDVWDVYHYDRLFVGSDYKGTERFNRYEAYFADKGVEIVYFPYTKSTSSTQIRNTIAMKTSQAEKK